MPDIRIDYDGLNGNKIAINDKISELAGLNGRLDTLLKQVEEGWEGNSAKRYIEKMLEHKKKSEKMIDVLTEFRSYIDKVVQEFQEEDRKDADRIKSC